uniref:CDC42 small effector 2 n=1 Tax=Sphaeramia orbicularis TaxID=375764 RepID=A0A673BPE3_9TELE
MTEFWVCFSCCIAEQPQPKRRRRIDRSMIGEPTNFVHTTHVGSGDMGLASVDLVQAQMKSKGGYAHGGLDLLYTKAKGRGIKTKQNTNVFSTKTAV